jgi:hypothetical protein
MIDMMLRKSNVGTGTVFVGGSIRDFCMWISGIIEFYQFKDIEIHYNTYIFDEDPDFDMPNKFHRRS